MIRPSFRPRLAEMPAADSPCFIRVNARQAGNSMFCLAVDNASPCPPEIDGGQFCSCLRGKATLMRIPLCIHKKHIPYSAILRVQDVPCGKCYK